MIKEITIENYLPQIGKDTIYDEIMEGLTAPQKYIPSKYFYDTVGSELFEEITRLEEYYPTRTEKQILSNLLTVLNISLHDLNIIELGSGDPSKIMLLLNQIPGEVLQTISYYPVDICESEIVKSIEILSNKYPLNDICGIIADFHHHLHLLPKRGCRMFCFFGGTIGNFTMKQAEEFVKKLSAAMNPGDHLLLGIDMIKDLETLESAYNDCKGVTSLFNLNILKAVNNIIGTDFNCEDFRHRAYYNRRYNRIEMHLDALRDMIITCKRSGNIISIKKGESIHTENSHKFTHKRIKQLSTWGNFSHYQMCHDPLKWFGVFYGRK